MTIIAFFPFDSGNGLIKSTEIISHGASGTVFGFNRVFFPDVSILTLWHLLQPLMYLAIVTIFLLFRHILLILFNTSHRYWRGLRPSNNSYLVIMGPMSFFLSYL